jgi:two-component system chemotaxis response regulator CheY
VEHRAGQRPVLAVDDDPAILDLMKDALSGEGYRVIAARNGAEALELLAEPPCVVLLDMRMPKLDGWGFAKAMRARGLQYPVVVVTAAENARRWALEIDAEAYLAKPFQIGELLGIVARFCPTGGGSGDTPSAAAFSSYQ